MRTPEVIKQLLANHRDYTFNLQELLTDALALIEQLERERDVAVNAMEENRRCETCKHYSFGYFCPGCRRGDKWEWRGV